MAFNFSSNLTLSHRQWRFSSLYYVMVAPDLAPHYSCNLLAHNILLILNGPMVHTSKTATMYYCGGNRKPHRHNLSDFPNKTESIGNRNMCTLTKYLCMWEEIWYRYTVPQFVEIFSKENFLLTSILMRF